jgi:hypothetical protein
MPALLGLKSKANKQTSQHAASTIHDGGQTDGHSLLYRGPLDRMTIYEYNVYVHV